jgi:hypothetical protein
MVDEQVSRPARRWLVRAGLPVRVYAAIARLRREVTRGRAGRTGRRRLDDVVVSGLPL